MKNTKIQQKVLGSVQQVWQKFSIYQKFFFVYFVVLLLLLIFVPLVRSGEVGDLLSTQVDAFGIFNVYMSKLAVLTSLILVFLIVHNSSPKRRYQLYKIFGLNKNSYFINITGLLIILIMFFSIGGTVTLIKQNMNSKVSTTHGFLFIGIYVIIGLVISIMITRIEHKKNLKTTEINVKTETDERQLEPRFEQAKEEVNGLFGKEIA